MENRKYMSIRIVSLGCPWLRRFWRRAHKVKLTSQIDEGQQVMKNVCGLRLTTF